MKLIKYLLPLLALPFFSSLSCGKDPKTNERPLIKLDEDFLSYVSFPKGSYWIFRETTTGETDSAYILEKQEFIEIDFPNASPGEKHRIEKIIQHEVIRGDTFPGHILPWFNSTTRISYEYSFRKTIDGTGVDWLLLIKYSDILNDSLFLYSKNPQILVHEAVIVGNIEYLNVIESFYEDQLYLVPYKRFLYAKNVGVIYREYWDGTTWELVRYHHQQ